MPVEVNVVPTGNPEYNMFMGDGDYGFGLRTRNNSLDFFIHADGDWRQLYVEHSTTNGWIGTMHQVAGIYDAENDTMSLYVDGKIIGSKKTGTSAGVDATRFPLTIGACPETKRFSEAEFYEARVYSKALTEQELASQNTSSPAYAPDSQYVQLWLDFDNLAEAEPYEPESSILYGDANCNGSVELSDALAILQYVVNPNKFPLTDDGLKNADVDGESGITASDALTIQMVDAGLLKVSDLPRK